MAKHRLAVEKSMANIIAASLPETASVTASTDLTIFGLSYDRGLTGQESLRSQIEAPQMASFLERLRARQHEEPKEH
jgi:hypothetical protein